jgi:hypothetical protein|nr:hypothetical protein [Heyndrickxia oleronia]
MYKKSLIIIGVILVIAVGLYIYSNNRIVEKEEAISENIEKTNSIDNIIKKAPPKLVELLKTPSKLPFKVHESGAELHDMVYRGDKSVTKTTLNDEEKASRDMTRLPYKEVNFEQIFLGDEIKLSILAQPMNAETFYGEPTDIKKIHIKDGSFAEYIDYDFNQHIIWKDRETKITYLIDITQYDKERKGKFSEQEITEMIESFKYIK